MSSQLDARPFACSHPECTKAFHERKGLTRHEQTHCHPDDRRFGCPRPNCRFRANQKAGVTAHVETVHDKIFRPCNVPGCTDMLLGSSSLSRHRRTIHRMRRRAPAVGPSRKKKKVKAAKSANKKTKQRHQPATGENAVDARRRNCTLPSLQGLMDGKRPEDNTRDGAADVLQRFYILPPSDQRRSL